MKRKILLGDYGQSWAPDKYAGLLLCHHTFEKDDDDERHFVSGIILPGHDVGYCAYALGLVKMHLEHRHRDSYDTFELVTGTHEEVLEFIDIISEADELTITNAQGDIDLDRRLNERCGDGSDTSHAIATNAQDFELLTLQAEAIVKSKNSLNTTSV